MSDNVMLDVTPAQQRAIEALANGLDVATAASVAGVTERTLYRWQRQDDFQDAMRAAQGRIVDGYIVGLAGMLAGNLAVLQGVRDDAEQPGHVRLKAVSLIDDSLRRWREHVDYGERLAQIERMLENAQIVG